MSSHQPASAGPQVATERVLPTLNVDGSRRWIRPRLSRGPWLTRRFAVGWGLIGIFVLLPWVKISGKPAILLDIVHREFTFAGKTFLASDGILLMFLMIGIFASVFLVTAFVGRAWCGWGCPQTVYLELVFRPLERLIEGPPSEQRRIDREGINGRRILKLGVYLVIAAFLGNTFLSYFVGWDALIHWMTGSPLQHPAPFLVMLVTTALVMADFAWFREQTCLVACPYGRFQAALLDKDSLIVGYDVKRGEPRRMPGRPRNASEPAKSKGAAEPAGDCVECGACVNTCPTGIDIRDGLQMECVGCTQCIDACDTIMDRVGKPSGLIRYTSQSRLAGLRGRLLRPRVIAYACIVVLAFGLLALRIATASTADVTVLRRTAVPYALMDDGRVSNFIRVKIVNRSDREQRYVLSVNAAGAEFQSPGNPATLAAGADTIITGFVVAPGSSFKGGQLKAVLTVQDGEGMVSKTPYTLLGP